VAYPARYGSVAHPEFSALDGLPVEVFSAHWNIFPDAYLPAAATPGEKRVSTTLASRSQHVPYRQSPKN
jgi:hypothetical protein